MRSTVPALAIFVVRACAFFHSPSAWGQLGQQPAFGQQGESQRFEVRGRVVNSVTGEGVPHALVRMYVSGEKAVFSGDDGGFDFTDVPGGSFMVVAKKPGFFNEQELWQSRPGPSVAAVVVPQAGEAVVKLTPEGIIYGKVVDENQEPIESVTVHLQTWQVRDGRKQLQRAGDAISDDRGEFRLAELRPGSYYLRFVPRAEGRAGLKQSAQEGFGTQFYPGVADVAAAGMIRVKAGTQMRIQQVLRKQRVYAISGVVRGVSAGNGFGAQLADSWGETIEARAQTNPNTGEFRLEGVPEGTYMLTVFLFSRRGENGGGQPRTASVPVQLHGDVNGLVMVPGRGASVGVQVDDERDETGLPEGVQRALVRMESREMPQWERSLMFPPPKGDNNAPREFEGLPPGTYNVEATPNGRGYVAELRCGSVDLLRDDLVVPAGVALPLIQVTLRDDAANLSVVVVKGGQSAAAIVVVYSEDYPKRTVAGWVGGGGSIGWGSFAPGAYKVIAVENAADLEYRNPAVMGKYLARAVEVHLAPQEQKQVRVEVQEPESGPEPRQ